MADLQAHYGVFCSLATDAHRTARLCPLQRAHDRRHRRSAVPNDTTEPLRRAIGERYLTYALSTIMNRALPDARDGLKPVHRRILYAMRELRLASTGGFRKSAKISGDVMGNYHPHGDAAIYDAMARLAQDFNVRYPLVDGQGNFGNIDGDNPAAARYTEARLTAAAEALMEGLAENAVDFRPNYDGTLDEPVVFPAAFPNLLANGSSGIAVGMATNIPPHNLHELIDACLHLIKSPERRRRDPDATTSPAPISRPAASSSSRATPSLRPTAPAAARFRLRARYEVEDLGRGQWQVVVTEIPYQVQKSQADREAGRDDQDQEGAASGRCARRKRRRRPHRAGAARQDRRPRVMMGMLFRNSDLEIRFA